MKTIKEFDIIQLKSTNKAIKEWFYDQINNGEIRNDTGIKHTVEAKSEDNDDVENNFNAALVKLGAKIDETVNLWISW